MPTAALGRLLRRTSEAYDRPMGRLAIVGGHSILAPDLAGVVFPRGAQRRLAHGARGAVMALDAGEYLVLSRHGLDEYTPAHLVDHARNLCALLAAGCDRILALSSVGSLRVDRGVGTFLAPDDFIALDRPATSVHGDARCHVVPGFSPRWRARVLDAWSAATREPLVDGGVYWQSNGPRFETPAEIRFIAQHADVVGMTAAAECVVANELGLDYAAVCVVDNVANGLGAEHLTREEFEAGKAANQQRVVAALEAIAPELAR
jgi:5'-methylthioadenosine phosphorylase